MMTADENIARVLATSLSEVCPACRGAQVLGIGHDGWPAPCNHCDGCGHVVTCLNAEGDNRHCRGEIPAHEVESDGAYCASCRAYLDVPEAAE